MKDIAEIVGVSESTVSRAINDKAGVGEETKQEILTVAKKYNFRPNQLARNLAKQSTNMLGMILPDISSLFYSEVARGIQDVARKNDYQLILCNTDNDSQEEKDYIEWMQNNKTAGIIFLGKGLDNDQIIKLGLSDYPLVLADRLIEELMVPSVIIDNNTGAYDATKHLINKGYKRIALINGPQEEIRSQSRLQGYKRALADFGIEFKHEFVLSKELTRKSGYQSFLELIELKEPPTAFFAANDLLAVGLVEAIKTGGYLIPQDIAVVGFEDTIVTSIINPSLTTVAQPMYQLGVKSAQKLLSLISEQEVKEQIEILETELIIRNST